MTDAIGRNDLVRVETTRYGNEALQRLTTAVPDLKSDDPMAPVTILVPNNIAGIVARRHLAAGLDDGSSGVAAVEITTLPRLAERLAAHTLAPRRPATRTVTAAWRIALSEPPDIFEPVPDHPGAGGSPPRAPRPVRQWPWDPSSPAWLSTALALRQTALDVHSTRVAR